MKMRVTVPGNILLSGEYIVTEPGGLGIALAIERRIQLSAEPAPSLEIQGILGNHSVSWTPDTREQSPLFNAVIDSVFPGMNSSHLPGVRITVDTSPFFTLEGKKRGFGSSASVAAGLCALLLGLSSDSEPDKELIFTLGLKAHRLFQNGRGSGYDIAASVFGGQGLFTGGNKPSFESCGSPDFAITLVEGSESVSSSSAIEKYQAWKTEQPGEWRDLMERSNSNVLSFARAENYEEAVNAFLKSRELGIELGNRINVDAHFSPRHPAHGPFLIASPYKSVGAGNELAVILFPEKTMAPFPIARKGILWE